MTEYKTHHVVSRLIELLGADAGIRDDCVETLVNSAQSFGQVCFVCVCVHMFVCLRVLCEFGRVCVVVMCAHVLLCLSR